MVQESLEMMWKHYEQRWNGLRGMRISVQMANFLTVGSLRIQHCETSEKNHFLPVSFSKLAQVTGKERTILSRDTIKINACDKKTDDPMIASTVSARVKSITERESWNDRGF